MTAVGDPIGRNGTIPDDVTDLADDDTKANGWGRWMRSEADPNLWNWVQDGDSSAVRRAREDRQFGVPSVDMVDSYGSVLRVLAVKPAAPGSLTLNLPEVPPGTKALIGNVTGKRYDALPNGSYSRPGDVPWSLSAILHEEHPDGVTVVKHEARTWDRWDIDVTDLPQVVDVEGDGRWRLGDDGLYSRPFRGFRHTLSTLSTFGKVTEVFDAEHS